MAIGVNGAKVFLSHFVDGSTGVATAVQRNGVGFKDEDGNSKEGRNGELHVVEEQRNCKDEINKMLKRRQADTDKSKRAKK